MIERERKFLVRDSSGDFEHTEFPRAPRHNEEWVSRCTQVYLLKGSKEVRVTTKVYIRFGEMDWETSGGITTKKLVYGSIVDRVEEKIPVSTDDARGLQILLSTPDNTINKTRFKQNSGWEIDAYPGEVWVAEFESEQVDELPPLPEGVEVIMELTGIIKNSDMAGNPAVVALLEELTHG